MDLHVDAAKRDWPPPAHVVVALIIICAHVLGRDPYYTLASGVWSGLLGALAFMTLARYATVWPARLPTVEVVVAFLYVQFGLAITSEPSPIGIWDVTPSPEAYESAALLSLASALMIIVGFVAATRGARPAAPRRFLPKLDPDRIARATALFVPVAALWVLTTASFFALREALGPVISILDGLLGKAALAVAATTGVLLQPTIRNRVRLGLAFSVLTAGMLVTSLLMEAVLPMAAAAAIFWRVRRRTPLLLPAAAIGVLLMLQPVKGTYRQLRWYGNYGVVEAWTEAFTRHGEEDADPAGDGANATRNRVGELSVLAYTVDMVPRVIPHTGGKAYPVVLAALVPRVLWPDKPNLTKAGTDVFTITLGIQTELAADRSAVGLSIPPHGYLEHGVLGTLMWTLCAGLVFGAITRFFGSSLGGTMAVGLLTLGLTYSSAGGLVYFFGSVLQAVIIATSFVWMLHSISFLLPKVPSSVSMARPSFSAFGAER